MFINVGVLSPQTDPIWFSDLFKTPNYCLATGFIGLTLK